MRAMTMPAGLPTVPWTRRGRWSVAVVAVAVLAATFWAGSATGSRTHWDRGRADIIGFESREDYNFVGLSTEDWTYAFEKDAVQWIDDGNTWHETGLPDCLVDEVTDGVRFAWVEAHVERTSWRDVVLVDCRG